MKLAAGFWLAVLIATPAAAQTVQQTIPLQPGWNAIYLEVQPEPRDPDTVFASLPVESVWHYAPSIGTATFISTPGVDDLSEVADWLGWFPGPPAVNEKALLTTLDELRVNRAYLVNVSGADPQQLVVTGRPSLEPFRWAPDAFTLTGFPVDGASPATFGAFFQSSAAHTEALEDGLIYRLSGSGVWEPVLAPGLTPIQPGVAYWVFTRGGSEHQGPLEVTTRVGDGLAFGSVQVQASVRVRKRSGGAFVRFDLDPSFTTPQPVPVVIDSPAPVPLAYRTVAAIDSDDGAGGTQTVCAPTWLALPASLALPSPACDPADSTPELENGLEDGQGVALQLGVVRRSFTGDVASVLVVSNGSGVRRLVPVSASR